MDMGLEPVMYQSAAASGRGIGKSSLTAWLILWMLTTRLGASVVVTANTEVQLKTRTWASLVSGTRWPLIPIGLRRQLYL